MAYSFYRISSARDGVAEVTSEDEQALFRESYGCRERSDYTLFVWRDAEGEVQMLQFLFAERFIEWFRDRTWIAGDTNRARDSVAGAGAGRLKGVRTLHGHLASARDAVLAEGLEILRAAALPEGVLGDVPLDVEGSK